MASPSQAELAQGLKNLADVVTTLQLQLTNLNAEVKAAGPTLAETARAVTEMRLTLTALAEKLAALEHLKQQPGAVADLKTEILLVKSTEIGLVKKDIDDLKKWQDDTRQREKDFRSKLWMIVPPLVAAFVSSLLTGIITILITLYLRPPR